MSELPLFPLGSVLFPHMALPLHIFESRYRTLIRDVLDGDQEFGVVLITRGHEVGGGEVRSDVGTVARILKAEELDDGRWLAVAIGTERFRVTSWLPDDPYPRAGVVSVPERPVRPDALERLGAIEPRLRRVLAMASELGDAGVPASFELSDDPETACWQAPVVAPLNPFDAQRILLADGPSERLELLESLLDDLEDALVFRLGAG